jgi:hypothetical protein
MDNTSSPAKEAMKKTSVFCSLAIALSLIACGGNDQVRKTDQAEYEVVQEGSAGGATSTGLTDGTSAPPMAMTGTNADTTTAFNLPTVSGAPVDPNAAPGTIASSLPGNVYDGSTPAPRPRVASAPRPQPQPRESVEPQPEPTSPMTSAAPEPAPVAENEKPAAEPEKTAETKEPPPTESAPATDTTQTDTQPPGL